MRKNHIRDLGSSLRWQGAYATKNRPYASCWITPADAGSTSSAPWVATLRPAHPLVEGKPSRLIPQQLLGKLIPARGGEAHDNAAIRVVRHWLIPA